MSYKKSARKRSSLSKALNNLNRIRIRRYDMVMVFLYSLAILRFHGGFTATNLFLFLL